MEYGWRGLAESVWLISDLVIDRGPCPSCEIPGFQFHFHSLRRQFCAQPLTSASKKGALEPMIGDRKTVCGDNSCYPFDLLAQALVSPPTTLPFTVYCLPFLVSYFTIFRLLFTVLPFFVYCSLFTIFRLPFLAFYPMSKVFRYFLFVIVSGSMEPYHATKCVIISSYSMCTGNIICSPRLLC